MVGSPWLGVSDVQRSPVMWWCSDLNDLSCSMDQSPNHLPRFSPQLLWLERKAPVLSQPARWFCAVGDHRAGLPHRFPQWTNTNAILHKNAYLFSFFKKAWIECPIKKHVKTTHFFGNPVLAASICHGSKVLSSLCCTTDSPSSRQTERGDF